jgi:processive 1,2-diacylglycerol beta-glucosyltransferase
MSTPSGRTEPGTGGRPRRALIVSGRFGKGHDTVAEACATALAPLGVESRIVDAIALLGGAASQVGERVFRTILDRPSIYDAFHFNQLRPGGWLARRMDDASLRVMWPQFVSLCNDWPPDLIVAVFATGAAASARYQRLHPEVTTAVFITDATAHALWVHRGIDLYVVPSRLGELAVRRYVPDAHVRLVTHPTRPEFTTPPTREAARHALGIPVDADCVLMMSGAWGIGPVAEGAEALARQGIWVLAVAGSNERLERRLRAVAESDRKVVPFGFTDRVPELMAASDVVVSSSGDTCREARVVGRSLLLLDVVPGHGRENLQHELELGQAWVTSPDPLALVASVEAVLKDPAHHRVAPVASPRAWESELRDALGSVGFP